MMVNKVFFKKKFYGFFVVVVALIKRKLRNTTNFVKENCIYQCVEKTIIYKSIFKDLTINKLYILFCKLLNKLQVFFNTSDRF